MEKEKIIIDTDIGDFIDDILALVFALKSEELDIIGVTTVLGDVTARAKIATELLNMIGKGETPVVAGLSTPMLGIPEYPIFQHVNSLPKHYSSIVGVSEIKVQTNAIQFMESTLLKSAEPITLLSIGPLTNIATLLTKNPDLKSKIKRIILMGGAYYMNRTEYNILCDPEASKIVFDSGVDLLCVGLDVTTKCQLTPQDLSRIKNKGTKVSDLLYSLITSFIEQVNHIPSLHDPLAIAVAIDESLVTLENKKIGIECNGEYTRGMTFNISDTRWWERSNKDSHIEICKTIDRDRFINLFLDRVLF